MTRFVLDNSVTLRWLFGDGSAADLQYADAVLEQLREDDVHAMAPAIWPLEIANVVTRAESRGLLSEARSAEFIHLLDRMGIVVDAETASHARGNTLELARRHNLSAYDAAYLELALRKAIPLATLDKTLQAALEQTGAARA